MVNGAKVPIGSEWGACSVSKTSETCEGLDLDCDGVPNNPPADPWCPLAPEVCVRGQPTCSPNGDINCVGRKIRAAEVCDGVDNDCDGTVDNDCTEPDFPRGGRGGGPASGPRGGPLCVDVAGQPVSMTTGNMSFGPLELVSLATPAGTPLRLAITYNSRNLLQGELGIGWTLNTEQRVTTGPAKAMYWSDVGIASQFPLPATAALEGGSLPDATLFTRSLGGANLGFYLATSGGIELCPQSPCPGSQTVAPRVVFEDGSTALFSSSGAFAGLRDLAGNEQRYFFPAPGAPTTTPSRKGLSQGPRSVALHRYSATRTDLVATAGSVETTVARVLLDGAGHLTDICAPEAPLPGASDACHSAGMRTLFHFRYVAVETGPMRLAEVIDEAGKTVERHQYQRVSGLGVLATTSESATESLSFTFTPQSEPTRMLSVSVRSAFSPAVTVSHTREVNTQFNRVQSVGETCGCGSSVARVWDTHPLDNVVPVIAQLRQGLTTSLFTFGSGVLDPYRFGRPTGERQRDEQAGVWGVSPERVLTFAYQHPLVRRPTLTTQPGNSGVKVSVSDYDDDDPAHQCREGVDEPRAGSPTIPNEAPTRFLCRVVDGFRVTHFRYDGLGRLIRSDGPDGVPVTYAYWPADDTDELRAGLLRATTRGEGLLALTTTFERYHFTGRPTRIVNANNEVTAYEFDLQGRVTMVMGPDGAVTRTEYAAGNKPSKVTLPSLVTIHSSYDAFGRLEDVTWRGPVALGAAVLQRQHRTFDLGGNVLLEQTYDASGALTRQAQRDYDEAHRVTREYGLDSSVWKSFEYHHGVLTQSTDEGGRVSAFEYDGFGRMRRTLRRVGGQPAPPFTQYGYDVMDNLAEVIDANGNPTRYFFDDFGQTLEVTTPNSGTTRYGYAADGALTFMKTESHARANAELRYTYDALRRPTGEFHTVYGSIPGSCIPGAPGSPPVCQPETFFIVSDTPLVTYGYDSGSHAKGRLSSVSFPGGARSLTWDGAGRLQSEQSTLSGLATTLPLARTYHPGGALASLEYPRQTGASRPPVLELDKGLDETLSEVRFGGVTLASGVTHYPFGGGVRSLTRGNGVASTFGEDLLGRRTDVRGGPVNLAYELKPTGDVRLATESGDVARSRLYGYDEEHRLTSAAITGSATAAIFSETYSYDEVGNRLLKVRNGTKQYVSVFDLRSAPGGRGDVPANDLLRAVIDPPVGGLCVAVDGGLPRGTSDDDDDEAEDDDDRGRGHGGSGRGGGHRGKGGSGRGGAGSGGSGRGGSGSGGQADAGVALDGGLPFCATRSPRELARLDAEWKAVAREAKRLVRDAPTLGAADAHNRLLAVLEQLRAWMEKYSVPTPSLLGVLAGTRRGGVDFATTMAAYLARRASGVDFGPVDLDLLDTLAGLAEKANVRQAVENDPTWRYTHDANGAVTSVTVEIPAFVLAQGPAEPLSTPRIHNTMCYRYDARQRLVQVETVVRSGAQVSSTTPPCEDAARATMATFRYDEANRRVYANVAGKETWELRGASGELLAEVSKAGEVERAYVYLDGEPLTVVALRPGKALRSPTTPLGCTSSGGGLSGSLAALVLLAVLLRRRNGRGALAALVLTLVGCDGQGPQAEPPPAPGIGELQGDIFYFHNDRLGTPVRLTNELGVTVWRADYRPFGDVERLETDVDGDGAHLEQPLRFPGQYEDALSGLILAQGPYYNWNRHYEPATGRYFSGEPMLQRAESVWQTPRTGMPMPAYAYAYSSPAKHVDPSGEAPPVRDFWTCVTMGCASTILCGGAGCRCTLVECGRGSCLGCSSPVVLFKLFCTYVCADGSAAFVMHVIGGLQFKVCDVR
ncbi:MAG: RHS repeat-associated core domain-containing protein [Archangium sp.]|nr:RHS repeat-associated core domain-containing protein [Archangium sp.]